MSVRTLIFNVHCSFIAKSPKLEIFTRNTLGIHIYTHTYVCVCEIQNTTDKCNISELHNIEEIKPYRQ